MPFDKQMAFSRSTIAHGEDEPVLLNAARGGDARAFGILLDRYRRGLEEYCGLMLGESGQGRDALQEIVLTAWRERGLIPAAPSARMWLYRLAVRVCFETLEIPAMSSSDGDRLTG